MVFGDKNTYAIEVYHQPLYNSEFYMSGKMCIHLFNKSFGDIDNEYCQVFMAYGTLLEKINNIDLLKYDFSQNNDHDIFTFLDDKLYMCDDKRTLVQIKRDAELYFKFNFMTNSGGETFDDSKSFIYMDKNEKMHIMYQKYNEKDKIICNELDKEIFENVTNEFIKWYEGIEIKNKK